MPQIQGGVSGLKAVEGIVFKTSTHGTQWRSDGTVQVQSVISRKMGGDDSVIQSPPWLWNVTDQTAPSIPAWMKDDELWQRALDAQD